MPRRDFKDDHQQFHQLRLVPTPLALAWLTVRLVLIPPFVLLLIWPTLSVAQGASLASDPNGGSKPIPDPTVLTTQAQERAIAALREIIDIRIKATEVEIALLKSNLDRTDIRLIKRLDDIPDERDRALSHLQRLMEEKFKGVDQQFQGRDVALAAALLAQKTSVDEQNKANAASSAKAEGATTKQIDGILSVISANSKANDDRNDGTKALLANQAKATDDKISDLRNSIVDLRTLIAAQAARGAGQNDAWAYIVAGGGLLIAFLAFIIPRVSPSPQPIYRYGHEPHYQQPPQVSVVPVVPVPVQPT